MWAPMLRYFKRYIIPFIGVMISIGFIFTEVPFDFYKTLFNTNAEHAPLMFTPTRFFHFGLGGLLAWLVLNYYHTPSVKLPEKQVKILQWTFLMPFLWYLFRELYFDKHERIINGIASVILVGIAISPQCVFNFEYKWMKYLGKISFGIYVFHMLGVHVAWKGLEALHISGVSFIILFPIIAAIIAMGLAVLSYEYFEKWFLKLKIKFK
jgi:peptidoglycan/LPS O-acetylase OafA/YrhL